jgi:hypothetical protein
MAIEFKNIPVLSKVKIGDVTYWLKDADVRELLATYKDAVNYSVDTQFSADSENLATSKAIAAYLQDEIAGLAGAMHFIGVKEALPESGEAGDIVIVGTTEYVHDGNAWVVVGDEGVYATKAGVEADYVKKTVTIANIDLKDNITADELKQALALKALAYKDSASATLTDYVTDINGAAYTPAGAVEVKLNQTSTAMESTGSFTPAGSVTGNVTAAGTVAIARDDANGVAVSGTVTAPTITVTPNTAEIQHIASLGELPSYTAAQYVAPSVAEAKAQFASEGMVATVSGEELVLSVANKADALTATGFNAGSYEPAVFNKGALPEFGAAQTVVTGIASASATAPVFSGDKFGATFAGTQVDITAAFAGQAGTVNVSGNYDKAGVESAAFTGTEATIKPELVKGEKIVTVQ